MTKRRMKYNPSFLSEQELIDSFVVRHADLEIIVRIIGENVTDSNQHVLVIGPRGSGKTTLVHRVAAEIEQNEDLRGRWYPLIFSEESYEVVSAGEFWLEALFHLAEQVDDERWKRTYGELKNETDDRRLADRALAQLLDFADSQGKRILMIVENLNMLLGDLTSEEEAWKIRHTLINEPRLMLLATATNRFDEVENTSQAMFEMFKMQELKPLDDDECNLVWEHITGQKLLGERIKPIRILTGGNPRLLTIIAKFSAHRSFRKLLDDLVDLIDDHTEYFKSHLDSLPAIERKVYLALAGLWDASTAREIAQAARLEVNKTSSLLSRLISRGAVAVEEQEKKIKWYVVAERMYNIYYLMRRRGKPADRVKATVKFLVSMYDPESAARLITEEACMLSPELRRDYCLAYEVAIGEISDKKLLKRIIASTPKDFLESPYFNETVKSLMPVDEDAKAKKEFGYQADTDVNGAKELFDQGCKLGNEGNLESAIDCFDKVIVKLNSTQNADLLYRMAMAMTLKAQALGQLDRSKEAVALSDEVVARFSNAEEVEFLEPVARAMVNKAIILHQLNRSEEAIAIYDAVVVRCSNAEEAALHEQVARAMVNKGAALSRLNRFKEEIAVYDGVMARFSNAEESVLREGVARAMVNKGTTLVLLNRSEEAIAIYDEVVTRFSNAEEEAIRKQIAQAMVSKAITLRRLNRSEEAIAVYDEVVTRFSNAEAPALREQVARAMVNKGATLGLLNRSGEEIAVYNEVVARFNNAEEAALREPVARAMVNKGATLRQLNRSEEAIDVYDEVVTRFSNAEETALRELAVRAIFNKGVTLGQLNRSEEAIAVYDEVLTRFSNAEDPALREQVARTMVNKGTTLGLLNRSEEAIAAYDEVVARFNNAEEAALREPVARAMVNKGVTLGLLNRSKEAIAVYDEVVTRLSNSEDAALREQVARAMVNKGATLGLLNRSEEAIAAYDEVVTRFNNSEEAALRELAAQALFQKGSLLGMTNKYDESGRCFRMAIELAPTITPQAVESLIELLLKMSGQLEEALQTADVIIAKKPEDSELLNTISWAFFKSNIPTIPPRVEGWVRKAVSLSPDDAYIHHTLACILSALGKGNEALESAKRYIQDTASVEKTIEEAIELFVELAAAGQGKEALGILVNSEAEKHLEPLVAGLKLYLGEKVKTAPEIREIAKDVVKRIEERVNLRDSGGRKPDQDGPKPSEKPAAKRPAKARLPQTKK